MASMTPLPQLQPMADPMEQYGRVVALKSMLQQQQMQQQQMAYQQQMQPLELQQRQNVLQQQQYELGRQKAINSALHDAYTMNPDTGRPELDVPKATKALADAGYGEASAGIIDSNTKMLQGLATLQETKGKVDIQERNTLGWSGQTMADAKYDPGVAMHSLQMMQKDYPNEVTPLIQKLQANPTPETVKAMSDQFIAGSPDVQEKQSARYRAEAAEWKVVNGTLVNSRTGETRQPTGDGMLPVPPELANALGAPNLANTTVTPEQLTKYKQAADAGQTITQAGGRTVIVDKTTGKITKDLGAATPIVVQSVQNALPPAGTPQQPDPVTQALLNGTPWKDIVSNRLPLASRVELLRRVQAVNPNYTTGDAQVEVAARTAAAREAVKGVPVIQTGILHVGQLRTANDAYQRGDLKALNDIAVQIGVQVGDTPLATYRGIQQVVKGDILAASSAIGAKNEKEEAAIDAITDPGNPARANNATFDAIDLLLKDRLKAKGEIYKQATTRGNIFQPQTGDVIYARDPQGNLHKAKPGTALPKGWTATQGPQ